MTVVVYECTDSNAGLYLERRDIVNGQMTSGTPLTKKCIVDIMNVIAVDDENFDYGIHGAIPSNLLYADTTPGHTKLVWYNPPQSRRVYFVQSLGIPNGVMSVPGLVYVADNGKLSVMAFKGNKPKGKLYKAPFMNVSETGVCLGNSKVEAPKQSTFDNLICYWEEDVLDVGVLPHTWHQSINGNLATLTKHLIESGNKFPNEVLIPSIHSLKSLLQ